jgi:hypothetical protein
MPLPSLSPVAPSQSTSLLLSYAAIVVAIVIVSRRPSSSPSRFVVVIVVIAHHHHGRRIPSIHDVVMVIPLPSTMIDTAPSPKNIERVIYEYVNREKDLYFLC